MNIKLININPIIAPILSIKTSLIWLPLPGIKSWCISSIHAYIKVIPNDTTVEIFTFFFISYITIKHNTDKKQNNIIWADFLTINCEFAEFNISDSIFPIIGVLFNNFSIFCDNSFDIFAGWLR